MNLINLNKSCWSWTLASGSHVRHYWQKVVFSSLNFFFFFLLYNIALVLPYINMNLPRVYTCYLYFSPSKVTFAKKTHLSKENWFSIVSCPWDLLFIFRNCTFLEKHVINKWFISLYDIYISTISLLRFFASLYIVTNLNIFIYSYWIQLICEFLYLLLG